MKTLLILRHAKSKPKAANLSDHDRELNEFGKDDALHIGKLLRYKDLTPDFIISSSALRAKRTAEIVAKECGYVVEEISLERSLYEANPKDWMNVLERLPDKYNRVLIVGHNPTIEEIVKMLTGLSDIIMPSSALAHLSIPIEKWRDLKIKTKHLIVLKEMMRPE
jgi:phosphohistidine phosphatase